MKRMAASNVLIVGLDGLGVEIGAGTGYALSRAAILMQPIFSQEHHLSRGQISDCL